MIERAQNTKEFRLLRFGDHGQHLAIQRLLVISGRDDLFELIEPLFAVEELASARDMLTHRMMCQTQVIEDDRRTIRPKTAAVQPHIEQPVIIQIRLFLR